MKRGGSFRGRLVAAIVIAALVAFGWAYLRESGMVGGDDCKPGRQVERDAAGTVVRITSSTCPGQ